MSKITNIGGDYIENIGGNKIVYVKGNNEIHSNKQIIQTAKDGIFYEEPKDPPKLVHPEIVEIQFLDDKNTVLKQSSLKNFGGIKATNILYGKKVKIKVITKEVQDGTKISFNLKGETKSVNQEFFELDKLKWNLEVKANSCETEFFVLNLLWYSEDWENYNSGTHKTEIKPEDLNNFYVKGVLNAKPFELPEKKDRLTPIAYLRNYEELIGLFNIDDLGEKDLVNNYENKFIESNSEILKIAMDFSVFINNSKDLKKETIRERVEEDATKLWNLAVKHAQGFNTIAPEKTINLSEKVIAEAGLTIEETHKLSIPPNLDDRALYWARNKIQVRLKRHFLFEKDIDFENSIVLKNSKENEIHLCDIIQLFEEKSRNYTGIDFSKAGNLKKVLITGFDPFQLDSNKLQSNPAGVVALALANSEKLNAVIQTMIFPVKYSDFDNSREINKGVGEGVVEKYIKKWISKVDMIITVSQALPNEYNIDMFATSRRGGSSDNMNHTRKVDSHALVLNNKDLEWIETTLPKEFTNIPQVKYEWEYNDIKHNADTYPKKGENIKSGSGSNYLSNEIFYRVAKMREEEPSKRGIKGDLQTGHFHISMIQEKGDLNPSKIKELLSIVTSSVKEGIKGIKS